MQRLSRIPHQRQAEECSMIPNPPLSFRVEGLARAPAQSALGRLFIVRVLDNHGGVHAFVSSEIDTATALHAVLCACGLSVSVEHVDIMP
jgi:hypothetical protein